MRVLCINCGSSTLKFDVLDVSTANDAPRRIASGLIDRVGGEAALSFSVMGGASQEKQAPVADHGVAMQEAMSLLNDLGLLAGIDALGHRVVHGGPRFHAPVLIDDSLIETIQAVSELAPLHNEPALKAIRAARDRLGAVMTMVATFDTAFFASLPEVASVYALPRDLSEKHSIRRYGFHGLAHRYMVQRFCELRPETQRPRLITLQLGNGCSATASVAGQPIDTSMGFTPLEGLIMGTRSGDIDPSLPLYIAEKEGLSTAEVGALLNTQSGLLGLSGRSHDMRDLLAASKTDDRRAQLAVEAFCYRAKKYVGAYLAALGGAEAIIFGGGIGQHSPEVRERICRGLEWAGLAVDTGVNSLVSSDARISRDGAALEAWVVNVDEAMVVAQDAVECLKSSPRATP
ncbi:MAG TPA: acetate/propionate family kinase [Dehalococcoidia bacterium]|nr:acetate/propionate family kinase [Dehalococcoidia bacterium]